jgi:hypothetical protein
MRKINCKTLLPVLFALACVSRVQSAPVSAPDGAAVPDAEQKEGTGSGSARILDKAVSAEIPGGTTSRTLDMLLEMQGKAPPQDPGQRARVIDLPARPGTGVALIPAPPVRGTSAPTASPPRATEGAFEDGAAFITAAKERLGLGTDAQQAPGQRSLRSVEPLGGSGSPRSESGADAGGRALVPRQFIQWIREHRSMVVGGAVALLAAMWGSSVYRSRRRR